MKSSIRPLGIITVSIFGFLIILTMYNNKSNFEMTAQEMQVQVVMTNYALDSTAMAKLEGALFVDIRDPQEFITSGASGTINIPLASILDDENVQFWRSNQPKVILSKDPVKGHEAWMLLTQMGVEGLFIKQ